MAGQGTWQNSLLARDINRDGTVDAFYDTVLDITWLADGNAGAGSAFDTTGGSTATDGLMNWADAKAWAASLNVFGITGWRLPTMIDTGATGCEFAYGGTDCGYNVQTISTDGKTVYNELAHLYYVTLGDEPYCNITGDCSAGDASYAPDWMLSNTGNFRNLQPYAYWVGVAYAPSPADLAWIFFTREGYETGEIQNGVGHVLAVRPGDVTASVPEPQSCALALLALGAAAAARRKRVG